MAAGKGRNLGPAAGSRVGGAGGAAHAPGPRVRLNSFADLEAQADEISALEAGEAAPARRAQHQPPGFTGAPVTEGDMELGKGDDPIQGAALAQQFRGRLDSIAQAAAEGGAVIEARAMPQEELSMEEIKLGGAIAAARRPTIPAAPALPFEEVDPGIEDPGAEERSATLMAPRDLAPPPIDPLVELRQRLDALEAGKAQVSPHPQRLSSAQLPGVAFTISTATRDAFSTLFNDYVTSDEQLLRLCRRALSIRFAGLEYPLTPAEMEEVAHRAKTNGLTLEGELKRMLDAVRPFMLHAAAH